MFRQGIALELPGNRLSICKRQCVSVQRCAVFKTNKQKLVSILYFFSLDIYLVLLVRYLGTKEGGLPKIGHWSDRPLDGQGQEYITIRIVLIG